MNIPILQVPTRIAVIDVAPDLPSHWQAELTSFSARRSRAAILTGGDPTSLEPVGTQIEYGLVDGLSIAQELNWLDKLYRTKWRDLAAEFAGADLETSEDVRNGVNINVVRGGGGRYEWHFDSNPCTALLFASTLEDGQGGELVFRRGDVDLVVRPTAGTLLIFDARKTPHTVRPVLSKQSRVSVPMNYFFAGQPQERPKDLNQYLYGTEERA